MMVRVDGDDGDEWFLGQVVCLNCRAAGPTPKDASGSHVMAVAFAVKAWMDSPFGFEPGLDVLERTEERAKVAEGEAARLRAVINKAVEDLPEWSAGALKHLSPAEVLADEVRMTLRAAVTR